MRKLVNLGAWTCVVIWSLLCWIGFGLIDVATGLAAGSSGIVNEVLPGSEGLTQGLVNLADDLGEFILFALWIGVSLLILGGAWVLNQVIGGMGQPRIGTPGMGGWNPTQQPPPYVPMGNEPPTAQEANSVLDRLAQKGFGPKTVGTLKRLPGQDQWKA
jgi:hypothetical protein